MLDGDGSLPYTPQPNYVGTDFFTYAANNEHGASNVATVTISVFNHAPQAGSDAYVVSHGETLLLTAEGGVLANDFDPDGDTISAVLVSAPGIGTLASFNSDGSFEYAAPVTFAGTVSFSYRATDGLQQSSVAMVTINVGNHAPVAGADRYSVVQNGVLNVDPSGVLENDWDADGDALTVNLTSQPLYGSLQFNSDGSFAYTAVPSQTGTDFFTYSLSDGVASVTQSVLIDVYTALSVHVDEVSLSPDVFSGSLSGTSTVTAIVRNNSGSPVPAGAYTSSFAAPGLMQASFAQVWHPVPFLSVGASAAISTTMTVAAGALPGYYNVVASVNNSNAAARATVFGPVDMKVERELGDGSWLEVTKNDFFLPSDNLRWTALVGPNGIEVDGTDWQSKPWEHRNNAAVPWQTFASASGDAPAYGNPGVDEWALRPVTYFAGLLAYLQPAEKRDGVTILDVKWVAPTLSDGATNFYSGEGETPGNPADLGGGASFVWGSNTPDGPVHDRLQIVVTTSKPGLKVFLRYVDPDDPTDHDGPIDDDAVVKHYDNFGGLFPKDVPAGDDSVFEDLKTSHPVGGMETGVAVFYKPTPTRPGDNIRAVVALRSEGLKEVLPLYSATEPETKGRLFYDADGSAGRDEEEPIIDETAPAVIKGNQIHSTKLVTIWRRVFIERDGMKAPGESVEFNDEQPVDDPRPAGPRVGTGGALPPPPDVAALDAAYRAAFIDFEDVPEEANTAKELDFKKVWPDMKSFKRALSDARSVDSNYGYWTVYAAAIYEFGTFLPQALDYNPDGDVDPGEFDDEFPDGGEVVGLAGEGFSVVAWEVLDDARREFGWSAEQALAAHQATLIHEVAHQLGVRWPDNLHPGGFPAHVMASYTSIDLLPTVAKTFRQMDIRNLRAGDVMPPEHDLDF